MRRPSVAEEASRAERARVAALSASERVALALALGERDLAAWCAARGVDRETGRLELERRRQAGRRPSRCIEALLG